LKKTKILATMKWTKFRKVGVICLAMAHVEDLLALCVSQAQIFADSRRLFLIKKTPDGNFHPAFV